MKISCARFEIQDDVDGDQILMNLERYARTCYKSKGLITPESARKFVARLIKKGHESTIEHEKVTVKIYCDRGVTHEIVRHRIGSYSQESTRYCNYSGSGIEVIHPLFFLQGSEQYQIWEKAMLACEEAYNKLIALGAKPQEARCVLPNSLKTEIVVTYNLREWRHFFRLRCAKDAHPQMREVAVSLLRTMKKIIPVIFEDIPEE